jgi:hypothetical protein
MILIVPPDYQLTVLSGINPRNIISGSWVAAEQNGFDIPLYFTNKA